MKKFVLFTLFLIYINTICFDCFAANNSLKGFKQISHFDEQEKILYFNNDVRILINVPSAPKIDSSLPVNLVLYALPNGNTIEQTKGKLLEYGDDWHFDIQHIAAQSRYVRKKNEYS